MVGGGAPERAEGVKTVFVDTSGFYAFLDPTDPCHALARDCFARAFADGWELMTTNYVVHETWALIQARLGWDAVDAWSTRMLPKCRIAWVDQRLHDLGAARCAQARERGLSLTDCISLAAMQARLIREAIAFDRHLSREGIALPGA